MVSPAELDELLHTRRSVRRFRAEAPPDADVRAVLQAALSAPSASNAQPWRFIVVRRRAVIAELADGVRAAVDRVAAHIGPESVASFRAYGDYFTRFEHAPVVVVALWKPLRVLSHLCADTLATDDRARIDALEQGSGLMGTAMALQNLLLCAHARGLAASGMTGPLLAADVLRVVLQIPPSWSVAALVPLGFAAEDPPPPERKRLDSVVRWIDDEEEA